MAATNPAQLARALRAGDQPPAQSTPPNEMLADLVASLRQTGILPPELGAEDRAQLSSPLNRNSHLPGTASSLRGQASSLPRASQLPGQAAGLPQSVAAPIVAIEPIAGNQLVVHIVPGPQDGRDAAQIFPDSRNGRLVAAHYAGELAHASGLIVADRTKGSRHAHRNP